MTATARRGIGDLMDELRETGLRALEVAADGEIREEAYRAGQRAVRPAVGSRGYARRRFSAGLRGWVRAASLLTEALYADGGVGSPLAPGGELDALSEAQREYERQKRALREALFALDDLATRVDRGWGAARSG